MTIRDKRMVPLADLERLQSLLEAANEMEADREAALQEIERLQKRNALLEDVAVAAEEITEMPTGEPDDAGNMKYVALVALNKLREVDDE